MPENYFDRYIPLLIQFGIAFGLAGGMVLLSWLIGRHKPSAIKDMPYESGIVPTGDARQRFSVKFYMVAMLFILFDIETIFLLSWAVTAREFGMYGFTIMFVYLFVLTVGLVYEWKKGVLDWHKAEKDQI